MPDNISNIVDEFKNQMAGIMAMSNEDAQSYANQLKQCRMMRENIQELQLNLGQVLQYFITSMNALKSEDYVSEELKNIASVSEKYGPMSLSLSHHLGVVHIGYINDREAAITATVNAALPR